MLGTSILLYNAPDAFMLGATLLALDFSIFESIPKLVRAEGAIERAYCDGLLTKLLAIATLFCTSETSL